MSLKLENGKSTLRVFALALVAVAALSVGTESASAISPKTVKATRDTGVKKIANLRVDNFFRQDMHFDAVKAELGRPGRVRARNEICTAHYFRDGLTLMFVTFGLYYSCDDKLLQTATIWKRSWKVKVSGRTYRVGMSKRKLPRNSKRIRGFGYQVATKAAFGTRVGTVFLQFNKRNRIAAIKLWIGAAGD